MKILECLHKKIWLVSLAFEREDTIYNGLFML
jgi:hypothetical protein